MYKPMKTSVNLHYTENSKEIEPTPLNSSVLYCFAPLALTNESIRLYPAPYPLYFTDGAHT
jgi:hypothetical protein